MDAIGYLTPSLTDHGTVRTRTRGSASGHSFENNVNMSIRHKNADTEVPLGGADTASETSGEGAGTSKIGD